MYQNEPFKHYTQLLIETCTNKNTWSWLYTIYCLLLTTTTEIKNTCYIITGVTARIFSIIILEVAVINLSEYPSWELQDWFLEDWFVLLSYKVKHCWLFATQTVQSSQKFSNRNKIDLQLKYIPWVSVDGPASPSSSSLSSLFLFFPAKKKNIVDYLLHKQFQGRKNLKITQMTVYDYCVGGQ